jgi:hypothetical protein
MAQYNEEKDQNTKVEFPSFDHVENAENLKKVFYPEKTVPSMAIVLIII